MCKLQMVVIVRMCPKDFKKEIILRVLSECLYYKGSKNIQLILHTETVTFEPKEKGTGRTDTIRQNKTVRKSIRTTIGLCKRRFSVWETLIFEDLKSTK